MAVNRMKRLSLTPKESTKDKYKRARVREPKYENENKYKNKIDGMKRLPFTANKNKIREWTTCTTLMGFYTRGDALLDLLMKLITKGLKEKIARRLCTVLKKKVFTENNENEKENYVFDSNFELTQQDIEALDGLNWLFFYPTPKTTKKTMKKDDNLVPLCIMKIKSIGDTRLVRPLLFTGSTGM